MKEENAYFLRVNDTENGIKVTFQNVNRLTVLHSEGIKLALLDMVTRKNSKLIIDLKDVKFIDSSIVDTFNLLSRMAHRYNSTVILTNVSAELSELIDIVRVHSVFDIKHVFLNQESRSVA